MRNERGPYGTVQETQDGACAAGGRAHDTSVGTAADVEAVMKKYDRESNTRVWEGLPKLVIRWLMVAFSAYCIIDTVFLSTRQEVRLPMFVGLILLFGFLTFPAKKRGRAGQPHALV